MLIYLLLVLVLFIFFLSYVLVNKDIFAPPVVFSGVFVIAILVAIPNLDLWAFDMGERTFMVLFLGIYSFCIGYFIIYFFRKHLNKKLKLTGLVNSNIYIKKYKLIVIFFIQVITLYLFYQDVSMIAANMGGGDTLTEKIFLYRINMILNENEYGNASSLTSYLFLICQVFIYILMYNFCEIYFNEKKINKKILFLIIVGLSIQILNGARGPLIDTLVSFFIMMYIFKMKKDKWQKMLSLKKIILMVLFLILFLVLFSSVGLMLVGREGQIQDADILLGIWNQISMYIAAPLKLLDLYMYTDYTKESIAFGIETFRSIYEFLSRYSLTSVQMSNLISSEFQSDNGQDLGNLYTVFRPYVSDFGYIGVISLSLLEGMVYAFIYFSIRYKNVFNKINYNIVLYVFLFIPLFRVFCLEQFYRNIINLDFIKLIIFYKMIECIFLSKKGKRA